MEGMVVSGNTPAQSSPRPQMERLKRGVPITLALVVLQSLGSTQTMLGVLRHGTFIYHVPDASVPYLPSAVHRKIGSHLARSTKTSSYGTLAVRGVFLRPPRSP